MVVPQRLEVVVREVRAVWAQLDRRVARIRVGPLAHPVPRTPHTPAHEQDEHDDQEGAGQGAQYHHDHHIILPRRPRRLLARRRRRRRHRGVVYTATVARVAILTECAELGASHRPKLEPRLAGLLAAPLPAGNGPRLRDRGRTRGWWGGRGRRRMHGRWRWWSWGIQRAAAVARAVESLEVVAVHPAKPKPFTAGLPAAQLPAGPTGVPIRRRSNGWRHEHVHRRRSGWRSYRGRR